MSISGTIDYIGDATIILSPEPLHYKYSPKQNYTATINEEGDFSLAVPIENQPIIYLRIEDESFPLIADSNDEINIQIERSDFPHNLQIQSMYTSDYEAYQNYLKSIDGLDKRIESEMNAYKAGEENEAIVLSEQKINLASEHLAGTKFSYLIDKAKGELVVNKIKSIEYRLNSDNFDAATERKKVLAEAQTNGVFTLSSLKAQRAGIRDITHYYARTFGIYDSVNAEYGKVLAEYDLKRIAYEELNKRRLEVIDYITDREAEAYARMFLVAERIGELDIEVAEPSYNQYKSEFSDYTRYVDFLTYFYNEIKSVSPGQPAIPFSLKDQNGNIHTLDDYKGKYVLLDFWAGWCQPCLDEFPVMREIYAKFSRDDFEILGISTEVDRDVWLTDIERFENPWPQLYGGNGFEQETFKAYKGGGIPFYILVDPDGNISRYNDIRATFNLEEVLNEKIND